MTFPIVALGSPQHRLYVTRLYRKSLRLLGDWYWQRSEFREKAVLLRALFEQNRHESSPQRVGQLLYDTEYQLSAYAHPYPYLDPNAPEGTRWERNTPMPIELIKRGVTPFDNYS